MFCCVFKTASVSDFAHVLAAAVPSASRGGEASSGAPQIAALVKRSLSWTLLLFLPTFLQVKYACRNET